MEIASSERELVLLPEEWPRCASAGSTRRSASRSSPTKGARRTTVDPSPDSPRAAELCALNVLAQVHRHVGFERIIGLNRIDAHMLTVDGWEGFPRVLDGASRLFVDALGDEVGRHARTPFGVERLPMDASIALTAAFTIRP